MVAAPRQARKITPTSPSPSPEPVLDPAQVNTKNDANVSSSAPAQTIVDDAATDFNAKYSDTVNPEEKNRLELETKVRSVVDLLYQLAVCAADVQPGSEHLIGRKVNECTKALAELDKNKVNISALVPNDVIEMLDIGKNPDIHTRNFINRLASENQYSYGQHLAMQDYHNQLNNALDEAFPDLARAKGDQT